MTVFIPALFIIRRPARGSSIGLVKGSFQKIMIYSPDEKQRMDNILEAFHDYISNHTFFDIVYSDKIGYFRIQVHDPDGEGLMVIHSVDKLLDVLFNEVSMISVLMGRMRSTIFPNCQKQRQITLGFFNISLSRAELSDTPAN